MTAPLELLELPPEALEVLPELPPEPVEVVVAVLPPQLTATESPRAAAAMPATTK
jgi:hypothetical protein